MSQVSKTTSCPRCGAAGFPGSRDLVGDKGYEMQVERCAGCGATKTTVVGTGWARELAGATSYEAGRGK